MLTRRRKSIVVLVGAAPSADRVAQALAESLNQFGFETVYLGRESGLRQIAATVVAEGADAVELCIDQEMGLGPLRGLWTAPLPR